MDEVTQIFWFNFVDLDVKVDSYSVCIIIVQSGFAITASTTDYMKMFFDANTTNTTKIRLCLNVKYDTAVTHGVNSIRYEEYRSATSLPIFWNVRYKLLFQLLFRIYLKECNHILMLNENLTI